MTVAVFEILPLVALIVLANVPVVVPAVNSPVALIEPPAAELAAGHATPPGIARLHAAVAGYAAEHASARAATVGVAEFFRAVAAAGGNRVLALTQEPLLLLLAAALEGMIDRAPSARDRIAAAQQRISAAIEVRDGATARIWMAKHVRDFRRGFEISGIDLDTPVRVPSAV